MNHNLYVIKSGIYSKIGRTSNVPKRMASYHTHNPTLTLLKQYPCTIETARRIELLAAERLEPYRAPTSKEWYEIDAALLIGLVESNLRSHLNDEQRLLSLIAEKHDLGLPEHDLPAGTVVVDVDMRPELERARYIKRNSAFERNPGCGYEMRDVSDLAGWGSFTRCERFYKLVQRPTGRFVALVTAEAYCPRKGLIEHPWKLARLYGWNAERDDALAFTNIWCDMVCDTGMVILKRRTPADEYAAQWSGSLQAKLFDQRGLDWLTTDPLFPLRATTYDEWRDYQRDVLEVTGDLPWFDV